MKSVTIHRRMIRQSPIKLRLVAKTMAKKSVEQSLVELTYLPKRAAKEVTKAVKSARAAALTANIDSSKQFISRITVDQGPALKRILPGPRGRTYRIKKMFSHLNVTVSDELNLAKHKLQKSQKNH